jgi:hypothetical protein
VRGTTKLFSVKVSRTDSGSQFTWHSPDTGGFTVSDARLIGFGNGKSPSPRAKGSRGLRLRHSDAATRPICLFQGIPLPLIPSVLGPAVCEKCTDPHGCADRGHRGEHQGVGLLHCQLTGRHLITLNDSGPSRRCRGTGRIDPDLTFMTSPADGQVGGEADIRTSSSSLFTSFLPYPAVPRCGRSKAGSDHRDGST